MYFSKNNEEITYINHYCGLLELEGKGAVCKEDAVVYPMADDNWTEEFHTLSVTEGITELKEGYLEAFTALEYIVLSRTVTAVATTEKLDKELREKKVLIRGEYDTFAERFAKEKGLAFLHCDIPIACQEDDHETDIITLRFHVDAVPDIQHDIYTPGSSAGSYGGGVIVKELPMDFYVGCTIEKFADNLSPKVRDQILANDMLRRFLEISNQRRCGLKVSTEK